jgi:hypothetical protein
MKPSIVVVMAALLVGSGEARADFFGDIDVRAFLGARLFSDSNRLGTNDAGDTSVSNSVAAGARFEYRLKKWLGVELETPVYLTSTREGGATILAFDPRVHAVFDVLPESRIQPFFVIGTGGPMSLSSDTDVLGHGISWEGYTGAGVRFERAEGWSLRADARWEIVGGREGSAVAHELEFLATLYRPFGPTGSRGPAGTKIERIVVADADGDGIADSKDECPDRAEDKDDYQDTDGCPDIDNDMDGVLDLADKCPGEKERYNGFQDDDGCMDFLPDDVGAWEGTYAEITVSGARPRLSNSAKKKLRTVADSMLKYPSIKVDIIARTPKHAAAVRDYLLDRGIKAPRLRTAGRGEGDDKDAVELKLRIPKGYE